MAIDEILRRATSKNDGATGLPMSGKRIPQIGKPAAIPSAGWGESEAWLETVAAHTRAAVIFD